MVNNYRCISLTRKKGGNLTRFTSLVKCRPEGRLLVDVLVIGQLKSSPAPMSLALFARAGPIIKRSKHTYAGPSLCNKATVGYYSS